MGCSYWWLRLAVLVLISCLTTSLRSLAFVNTRGQVIRAREALSPSGRGWRVLPGENRRLQSPMERQRFFHVR
jgi:hypothetical protein